jgi:hypothetical protein
MWEYDKSLLLFRENIFCKWPKGLDKYPGPITTSKKSIFFGCHNRGLCVCLQSELIPQSLGHYRNEGGFEIRSPGHYCDKEAIER